MFCVRDYPASTRTAAGSSPDFDRKLEVTGNVVQIDEVVGHVEQLARGRPWRSSLPPSSCPQPLAGQPVRPIDVIVLSGLIAAAQQQNQQVTVLRVVDAVTGADIQAKPATPLPTDLARRRDCHSPSDRCASRCAADQPCLQLREPHVEVVRPDDLDHVDQN